MAAMTVQTGREKEKEKGESKREQMRTWTVSEQETKLQIVGGFPLQWGQIIYITVPMGVSVEAVSTE